MKFIFYFLLFIISFNAFSQDSTSVLFVGNSFTFYNNMPYIFKDIAESKGKKVHVDTAVTGGKDLKFHSERPRTYQMIQSRKWDYVVLQGHSNEFAQPDFKVDSLTFPYAKKLVDSVHKYNPCARILFYMTWGYKNGNKKWKAIASYDSMQLRIERQYLIFADKLSTGVSPVGMVWKEVRESNPEINLYQEDRFHPILTGSYLSACTHFTTIFGESPYQNTAKVELNAFEREVIEIATTKIVLNNLARWRYLPTPRLLELGFDLIQKGKTVQVISNAKNYTSLSWDFGNGVSGLGDSISNTYTSSGEYVVSQKISNACKENQLARKIKID